jgi:hypothetical protein
MLVCHGSALNSPDNCQRRALMPNTIDTSLVDLVLKIKHADRRDHRNLNSFIQEILNRIKM